MHLLHLPKLGYTMENGSITDWLVPEGTEFAVGDPLYEVETEKNVVQVEARLPGTLVRVVAPRDSELGVGGLVAVIADPGEAPSDDDVTALIAGDGDGDGHGGAAAGADGGSDAAAAAGGADDGAVAVSGPVSAGDAAGEPSAVGADAVAGAAGGTDAAGIDVTHQLDAPAEGPAALAAPASGRVRALPKVRAAAERLGVDLASLSGTGPRGTLTVDDVERAAAAGGGEGAGATSGGAASTGAGGAAAASGIHGPSAGVRERRTLTGVRKAMAAGVAKSWAEVPQFVQQFSVDMTAVNELRAARRESGGKVGLTAVLLAAIARAVEAVPEVNASISGTELTLYSDVNVAVAVNTERGLVVPPVAGVQSSSLAEIEANVQKVVQDARSGSLPTEVLPTITLSNLGGFGVETGMPLVTAPQAAIVFTGDVVDRVVALDGQVVVRPMLGIAVGYDHRVVDGATGGAFCKALREALEDPGWVESAGGGGETAAAASGIGADGARDAVVTADQTVSAS